jgi:hypothetical protein
VADFKAPLALVVLGFPDGNSMSNGLSMYSLSVGSTKILLSAKISLSTKSLLALLMNFWVYGLLPV